MIYHFGREPFARALLPIFGALCLVVAIALQSSAKVGEKSTPDPWDNSQIVMPEALAQSIVARKGKEPQVIYVGFDFLYKSGRIRGAKFVGTGRDARGIEALKKWARGIKPGEQVVIYCGCCPFKDCPNIRPAYEALRQMGLTELKVLYMKEGFGPNWLNQGYPSEKGSAK